MSSVSIRLNDELVSAATVAGAIERRPTPKQIEYWADIGRRLAGKLNPSDMLMLAQGLMVVKLEPATVSHLDHDQVLAQLMEDQLSGALSQDLRAGRTVYQPAAGRAGFLDALYADGRRETGRFVNGEFVAEPLS